MATRRSLGVEHHAQRVHRRGERVARNRSSTEAVAPMASDVEFAFQFPGPNQAPVADVRRGGALADRPQN